MDIRRYDFLGECRTRTEQGETLHLIYELVIDARQNCNLYGLRVRKLPGMERETLPCLSYSRHAIEELGRKCIRCEVTPMTLAETVDDYIC